MTRLMGDKDTPAVNPARVTPAPAASGPGRRARRPRWWPPLVVAAGALTGAGLGYRVGARHHHHGAAPDVVGVRRR